MLSLKFLIVLALLHLTPGKKLPKFIKICNRGTINLPKCIEDNANYALPYILKGVKEINISPLKNLALPKISAPSYASYNFNFEGNITNLEGVTLNDTSFDLQSMVCKSKFIFPKLELLGNYKIEGFVGKIPVTGKGPANITLYNTTLQIVWTNALFEEVGLYYYKHVTTSLVSHNISSINYNFHKLLDGDEVEGKTTSEFLNEYWWILGDNFLSYVPTYLVQLAYEVVNKISRNVAFDNVLTPA